VSRARNRIRPLDALRAIRALVANPDDTARVFDVIDALSGRSGERLFERFRRTPSGLRLLDARPDLLATLSDREALLALPPGSLGHCYAEFMGREEISADGLVAASVEGGGDPIGDLPEERRWFGERMRDMHDLWHVVTGYQRDLLGEASLLAFTYAQTRNRGIGLIVATALWKVRGLPGARELIRGGHRRGRDAEFFPGQPWEELLPLPLGEVRDRLRVGAPPHYEQVRSEGAPAEQSAAA
jgi:ubiquinone biosynthesis protein COQ4